MSAPDLEAIEAQLNSAVYPDEFVDVATEYIRPLVARLRELTPRVLDGDPEEIEKALDALPVQSLIEVSDEAKADGERQVWIRSGGGWFGTGSSSHQTSRYLARYCAPLTVLR